MDERFNSDLGFILVTLFGAAILGFIIGYVVRARRNSAQREEDFDVATANHLNEIDGLRIELKDKKREVIILKSALDNCQTQRAYAFSNGNSAGIHEFNGEEAKRTFGKRIKEDDLKVIEGIGPAIESALKDAGISTWKQLSESQPENIKAILNKYGKRFQVHNPETWPKQSSLAYDNKWNDLLEYQDFLQGGVVPH